MNIREELAATVGHPVSDAEWSVLVADGWVGEVEVGAWDVDDLAAKYRALRAAFGGVRPPRSRVVAAPPVPARLAARARAVSRVVAALAGEHPSTVAWRAEHLPGGLLAVDELEEWLATVQGPAGGDGVRVAWPRRAGERWEEVPVVGHGPVLAGLARVAAGLARTHRWQPGEATLFVVAGEVPYISPVTYAAAWRSPTFRVADGLASHSVTSRLTIEVDPVVRPEELAASYRQVRRRFLPDGYHPQSEKHLELAAFGVEQPAASSWAALADRWNRLYPRWAYGHVGNFARDWRAAYRRLMNGPGYRPS